MLLAGIMKCREVVSLRAPEPGGLWAGLAQCWQQTARRWTAQDCVWTVMAECVCVEAVAPKYAAIILSLFHSPLLAGVQMLLSLQTEWIMLIRGLMAEQRREESV